MKFKRILATAFALALVLPLLTVTAHPGRTDTNGGHTDSDTGDYHYHHGYEAHAHFDIDGNGTTDCPYDFDDQTGTRSGPSSGSGSYSPGDGSEDGYPEGYADGYKKGASDGWTDGYETAVAEFEKDLIEQEEHIRNLQAQRDHSDNQSSLLLLACAVFAALFFISYTLLRKEEHASETKLKRLQDDCTRSVDRLSRDCALQITTLNANHQAELQMLRRRLANFKRLEVLELIAQGKDDSIQLPDGVALRPSYTPIRGKTSKHYPYGSYTIFMAVTGKTYHCLHDCVPNARPSHFFDRPKDSLPCRKCVPSDAYPQDLPGWYTQLREKVESIVPDESAPGAPHRLSPAADDQIRFSLDDPQIQFSFKDNSNAT